MSFGEKIGRNVREIATAARSGPSARARLRRRYLFDALRRVVPAVGVETDQGVLFVSTADRTVGRAVFTEGGWEPTLLPRALAMTAGSGSVIVDVGANVGTTSIPAARLAERVIAIEPAPENLRLLRASVAANGLDDRVEVVEAACSASAGEGWLTLNPVNWGDNRVAETGDVRVPLRRLDDILAERQVEPSDIRLLWIDTQGHEPSVLAGAERTLSASPPLLMELWPSVLGADGVAVLVDRLGHYGRCVDMTTGAETTLRRAAEDYRDGLTDVLLSA